jgi:hypothetical protein
MKLLVSLIFLSTCVGQIMGQCPPLINITTQISGLYTSDLNPAPNNTVYADPSATITGNINLKDCSLFNCGAILSHKITIKQTNSSLYNSLESIFLIKSDSIIVDSLGILKNDGFLYSDYYVLKNNARGSNNDRMDVNTLNIENGSSFVSIDSLKVNKMELKDTNSNFAVYYISTISIRKSFKMGSGTSMSGEFVMCVDSSFINNGDIVGTVSSSTWFPSVRVNGISQNTGSISTINFCDQSSTSGGFFDQNSGTLVNISFCPPQQPVCNTDYTAIKENYLKYKQINIFPNPSSNILNITAPESIENEFEHSEIEIMNYMGQTILKLPYASKVIISSLLQGIYVLKISTPKGIFFTSSFIKE